jgi:hypothetical protein
MIFVPRDVIWPGQTPTNSDGTPRPQLAPDRPWYTIHYTGGGVWLDPHDSYDELLSIHRYAVGAGKGWEYNYVIDGQGVVGEYAGDYRAAHSSGENDQAIGVLLLVGFAGEYPDDIDYWEHPPRAMIDACRELRAWLEARGMLAPDHDMLQHNQMPDAATACPGDAVKAAWTLLTAPWTGTEPDPPPTEDDNMYLATLSNGDVVVVGSAVRPVSGDEIAAGGPFAGLPRYTPAPGTYWHEWLRAGADEYARRVQV